MGPRLFSRGNSPARGLCSGDKGGASMGPRLFSRGNICEKYIAVFVYHASMGPRLFSRGNDHLPGVAGGLVRYWLQWGHDFSAVEIVGTFNATGPGVAGFNGATTFQPWKYD